MASEPNDHGQKRQRSASEASRGGGGGAGAVSGSSRRREPVRLWKRRRGRGGAGGGGGERRRGLERPHGGAARRVHREVDGDASSGNEQVQGRPRDGRAQRAQQSPKG